MLSRFINIPSTLISVALSILSKKKPVKVEEPVVQEFHSADVIEFVTKYGIALHHNQAPNKTPDCEDNVVYHMLVNMVKGPVYERDLCWVANEEQKANEEIASCLTNTKAVIRQRNTIINSPKFKVMPGVEFKMIDTVDTPLPESVYSILLRIAEAELLLRLYRIKLIKLEMENNKSEMITYADDYPSSATIESMRGSEEIMNIVTNSSLSHLVVKLRELLRVTQENIQMRNCLLIEAGKGKSTGQEFCSFWAVDVIVNTRIFNPSCTGKEKRVMRKMLLDMVNAPCKKDPISWASNQLQEENKESNGHSNEYEEYRECRWLHSKLTSEYKGVVNIGVLPEPKEIWIDAPVIGLTGESPTELVLKSRYEFLLKLAEVEFEFRVNRLEEYVNRHDDFNYLDSISSYIFDYPTSDYKLTIQEELMYNVARSSEQRADLMKMRSEMRQVKHEIAEYKRYPGIVSKIEVWHKEAAEAAAEAKAARNRWAPGEYEEAMREYNRSGGSGREST